MPCLIVLWHMGSFGQFAKFKINLLLIYCKQKNKKKQESLEINEPLLYMNVLYNKESRENIGV